MRTQDKAQNIVRSSMDTPFALCDECATLFTAAFHLQKLPGEPGKMVTCSNCRKKKPGAEYVAERKVN